MIRTKKANRFQAGQYLTELIDLMGEEEVGHHFGVKRKTIQDWKSDVIPASKCAEVGVLYREKVLAVRC
jgi:hypothetical protein